MAISTVRFRTYELTSSDTVNGHLITPTTFDASFAAGKHRFKIFFISAIVAPATTIQVKGALADPWVDITTLVSTGNAKWIVYGIDQIYIKTNSATGKVHLISYISNAQNSGY